MGQDLKKAMETEKLERIMVKPLHRQFIQNFGNATVDRESSVQWLTKCDLKGETESLIIAAQDQALQTKYYKKMILHQDTDSSCRMCHRHVESISHVISGCSTLAAKEYLDRHNRVARYIHWKISKECGNPLTNKWYEHTLSKVTNLDQGVLMWDHSVITDRTIPANRPDLIYHDKHKRTCLIIDVAVPDDSNVAQKEVEKLTKYKDLQIEIQRMWGVRAQVIPVVIGALGTMSKKFKDYLNCIPGNPSPIETQKIALCGTAHILRKVLE